MDTRRSEAPNRRRRSGTWRPVVRVTDYAYGALLRLELSLFPRLPGCACGRGDGEHAVVPRDTRARTACLQSDSRWSVVHGLAIFRATHSSARTPGIVAGCPRGSAAARRP